MVDAFSKAGGLDVGAQHLVSHHRNSTEEFIQNILAVLPVILETADNPGLLTRLLRISESNWFSTLTRFCSLLAKSNNCMGLDITTKDRQMISDLLFCSAVNKPGWVHNMLTPIAETTWTRLASGSIEYGMSKVEPLGMKVAISHLAGEFHALSFKIRHEEGRDLKILISHIDTMRGTVNIEECIPYGTGRQKIFWSWLVHVCSMGMDHRSLKHRARVLRNEMEPEGGESGRGWSVGLRDILTGAVICSNEWACNVAKMVSNTNPSTENIGECVRDALNMMHAVTLCARIHIDEMKSEATVQVFNNMPILVSKTRLATEVCLCKLGVTAETVRWAGANWYVKVQLIGRLAQIKNSEVVKAISAASIDWVLPDEPTSIDRMGAVVRTMSECGNTTLLGQLAIEEWSWSDYSEESLIGLERYVHGRASKGGLGITSPCFKQYTIRGEPEREECQQGTLGDDKNVSIYETGHAVVSIPTARGLESLTKIKEHNVKWEPGLVGLGTMVSKITGADKTKDRAWGERFKLRIGMVGFVENAFVPLLEWYGRKLMSEGKGLEQAREEVACAALDMMTL